MHRRVGGLVDFNVPRMALVTVSLDDAIVVAAKAAAIPGALVPDATLVGTRFTQRGGGTFRVFCWRGEDDVW